MKTIIEQSRDELTNKEKYQLMVSKTASSLKDFEGPMTIKNWVLIEDDRTVTEEVGEKRNVLSLLTDDGATYVTTSPTFIDSFMEIVSIFGKTDLEINVKHLQSKKGRTFLVAEYDGE